MSLEVWRSVVGHEGLYEVSSLGKVKSLSRIARSDGRWKARRLKEKILRQQTSGGYRRVSLGKDSVMRWALVHIVMLEAFVELRPMGMEGCHNNSNSADNVLSNLRWGTPKSNQADRVANGTSVRGEGNGRTSLTEKQVEQIRVCLKRGERGVDIAAHFKVSKYIISAINTGKTWNKENYS